MLFDLEKFSLRNVEEKVLKFWRENQIFEKSVDKRKNGKKFIFYEGPPTANGRPGIHHVLTRAFKDIILRYKTMQGFFVPRQAGWDTHGLPVEIEVEKKLGLKTKKEIEKYGIDRFNEKCRESVWLYKDEWERLTERIGFWLDLRNAYITYQNSYIDKLWLIIKKIAEKKLLYKDYKIVPWCVRCGTSLSSHEIALGYQNIKETSLYVKFKIKGLRDQSVYILSWTTTPWTLPGNVALAIHPDFDYVKIKVKEEFYILAKERLNFLFSKDDYEIIEEFKGKKLVGLSYQPLFEIKNSVYKNENAFRIYPADFVNLKEGTGVVHTAVMYGEEDYELGKKYQLPQFHIVNEEGFFKKETGFLSGLGVKDLKTEQKIIDYLQKKNFLLKTEAYLHDYPFCWRCQTPILYYARSSWFIKISALKEKLIKENKKINWLPTHIKEGRFGEWLKEIKDWNFSRERYWGTPLPVWVCENCGFQEIISGQKDLLRKLKPSSNRYFLLRHGFSETNLKGIINYQPENQYHLTLKGIKEIEQVAKRLKNKKVDFIFCSDLTRTKETAKIIAEKIGAKVIYEKRLREINLGTLEGKKNEEFSYVSLKELFYQPYFESETLRELAKRVFEFIKELEKKYENKVFLIVSHEYPLWMLESVMQAFDEDEALLRKLTKRGDYFSTGELREVKFLSLPRNNYGFGDLHRPYIDYLSFKCLKCSGKMKRVKEVIDVWFDSGAMPFASKPLGYPADYIAEAIDQTRGWFYTLLAVGILLDKGRPYKNVISLGHVLDKNGQKMSKSKGNVVDPWLMIEKYGIDSVRWYFYTLNAPGEPKRFNEDDLAKVFRQFILLIFNIFIFYKTYGLKSTQLVSKKPKNVLDKWILIKLNKLIKEVTQDLNNYYINNAARKRNDFVDDLSRWYLRRSRKRFQKVIDQKDYQLASLTLRFVLVNLAKLLAPFTPFFAEALYKSLVMKNKNTLSVHLSDWPNFDIFWFSKKNKILEEAMTKIREIASSALALRANLGIKVRQPLASLKINDDFFGLNKLKKVIGQKDFEGLLLILKEEINVKEVVFDSKLTDKIELDTKITLALKQEGWLREIIRLIQDLRQEIKLQPRDLISLNISGSKTLIKVIEENEKFLKKEVNCQFVEYKKINKYDIELDTKIDDLDLWLGLRKIN